MFAIFIFFIALFGAEAALHGENVDWVVNDGILGLFLSFIIGLAYACHRQ